MDMNIDCQKLILEELDFNSLMSMAETSNHISILTVDILRRRFAQKKLVFAIRNSNSDTTLATEENDHLIKVQDRNLIRKVLQNFGHVIDSLEIVHDFLLGNQTEFIYTFTNLYCSETLTQLHLFASPENAFDEFTKPFKSVQSLLVSGSFDKLQSADLSLSQLFPAMSRLTVATVSISDMNWVAQTFPNLVHLEAHVWSTIIQSPQRTIESKLNILLVKNPQIRRLLVKNISPNGLRAVATKLPNLERLDLQLYEDNLEDFTSDAIEFANLKVLKIEDGLRSCPRHIVAKRVENVEFDAYPPDCQRWIEFVSTNQQLKKLKVNRFLGNEEIERLARAKLNLIEVDLPCDSDVEGEHIVKMLENFGSLKRMHLQLPYGESMESVKNALKQKEFGTEWNIMVTSYDISIERKV